MIAANGDDNEPAATDLAALFAEIAELKRQRDDCTRQLAACRKEVQQLREQLEERP